MSCNSELDLFRGLSFTTISATGPNGGKSDHELAECVCPDATIQRSSTIAQILTTVLS